MSCRGCSSGRSVPRRRSCCASSFADQHRRSDRIYLVAFRPQQKFKRFENMLLVVGGENAARFDDSALETLETLTSPVLVEVGMVVKACADETVPLIAS